MDAINVIDVVAVFTNPTPLVATIVMLFIGYLDVLYEGSVYKVI